MKKYIFLDIDGVLCHYADGKYHYMHEKNQSILGDILEETGAWIVISSSWRRETVEDTKDLLESHGFLYSHLVMGVTERLEKFRGKEIDAWLKKRPLCQYVILDDDKDMLPHQENHFVWIENGMHQGLTEEHKKKAIEILNSDVI